MLTCCQSDSARYCVQVAVIVHLRGNEVDVPLEGANRSVVGNGRGRVAAEVQIAASHELGVVDVESRSRESADLNVGSRSDQDAVGIDEEHLAIRLQRSQQRRRIIAGDAIENRRLRAGLHELRHFADVDREPLPIDDGTVRPLRDGQRVAGAVDRSAAGYNGAVQRVGQHRRRAQEQECNLSDD